MANYSLILMIVIMVSINAGLGLYDLNIQSYNPYYNSSIDYSNTPVATMVLNGDLNGDLNVDDSLAIPETSDSVDENTGNIFTDVFKTMSNWLTGLDTAFSFIKGVLRQPAGFLKDIGVPNMFSNIFGLIWYTILIFLIAAAAKGGGVD